MLILKILGCILGTIVGIILLAIIWLAVSAAFVDPKKEYTSNSRYYRFLLYLSTTVGLAILRVKIHVTGLENIPSEGKFLLVGNHRSNFDPIVTWHILPDKNLAFISKPENFKIPIYGRIARRCCFMAIDRVNPMNALRTIGKAAKLSRETPDMNIAVYPEGTRSKDCKLLPFHDAIFAIAQKAECPIVILAVRGTEMIQKNYPFKHTDVYLDFSAPIPVQTVLSQKGNITGEAVRSFLLEKLDKQD